ncbi:hypothetical protein GCK72_020291 [Caenorhabditis remanei]|uniref:G-protein coupled receptors family 1 profile domain-containing protein n=1 Tax=Caenorhabditis remanei TaxID=31234 RepID=A0A6A5GG47_CAERE|nr:hypothetical protein GCK72_020291 [Caenorhabditis remanei]KAF1753734.1 hypothetical protein GCK72_020291 [Caenorhabditis remanei]
MPKRINTIEEAERLFPSVKNAWFLFKLFVVLEEYTQACVKYEFFLSIIGLTFTVFHLYVLTRKGMMTSSIFSIMIGIGVCDAMSMMIAIYDEHIIEQLYGDECTPPVSLFILRCYWILNALRQTVIRSSLWLGVLMALIRYLSLKFVTRPKFQRMLRISYGFYATGISFALSSVLSTLNFVKTKAVENGFWRPSEKCDVQIENGSTLVIYGLRDSDVFSANDGFYLRIFTLVNSISSKFLPCIVFPVVTILLIIEIHETKKKVLTSSLTIAERTTSLVIFMAITFFIASFPAGVFTFFSVMYTDIGFCLLRAALQNILKIVVETSDRV